MLSVGMSVAPSETPPADLKRTEDTPFSDYVTKWDFDDPNKLLNLFVSTFDEPRFAFRGHANADWRLEPTSERISGLPSEVDEYVLNAFKRRAHQYLADLPDPNDTLEWLALAQHYGAPTSLLDFTKSPYIATFFAVSEQDEDGTSAVWAFDRDTLKSEARNILSAAHEFFGQTQEPLGTPTSFNRVFPRSSQHPDTVISVEPRRMNERLTVQQGIFYYPTSRWDFELALKLTVNSAAARTQQPLNRFIHKFMVPPSARRGLLKELHRMNVTYASLFPGLEGFARSLRTNAFIRTNRSWFSNDDAFDCIS